MKISKATHGFSRVDLRPGGLTRAGSGWVGVDQVSKFGSPIKDTSFYSTLILKPVCISNIIHRSRNCAEYKES